MNILYYIGCGVGILVNIFLFGFIVVGVIFIVSALNELSGG